MITVNVGAPIRGTGQQSALTLYAKEMRGSFAWGSNPSQATLTYAGSVAPVTLGAHVAFTIGGHYFAGVCVSDVESGGTQGVMRALEFMDLRYFLQWDWVFGYWNMPDVRLVNGRRVKRYRHLYPVNWRTQTPTFTDAPHTGAEIVAMMLQAPTVFALWQWDFTGNGLFPDGLLDWPVYEVDASSGLRLDAALNVIGEKTGLVFCHDPKPGIAGGDWRLTWTRKGAGVLPLPFPANSDERRYGWRLTENAVNVCVLGDRNRYQWLNVPMKADWAPGWVRFLDLEELVYDLYEWESGPNPLHGGAVEEYADWTNDVDHWFGYGAAAVRAREITVAQYIALVAARAVRFPGASAEWLAMAESLRDGRKVAGRWRMDMPAALYVQTLVCRAFRPDLTEWTNAHGDPVPLAATTIADQLLCRVDLDYQTGAMTAVTNEPVDSNGVLAVKGHTFGEDLFRLASPDRVNAGFWSAANRQWASVNFQIDDSGEGVRFLLAEQPVFVQDDAHPLMVEPEPNAGYYVLNAQFQLRVPAVKAALVFEGERFEYWRRVDSGTWRPVNTDTSLPLPGRSRVESVNGLQLEQVKDGAAGMNATEGTEITYADGVTAATKAERVAQTLLLCQEAYLAGGYNLKWPPGTPLSTFGTPLAAANSSCIDRLEISYGTGGVMEVVDFTTERQRRFFEPERELERRTLQNSLSPGQAELRQYARDQRRLNSALRQLHAQGQLGLFQKILRGEIDGNLRWVRLLPASVAADDPETLPAGTPLWQVPSAPGTSGNASMLAPGDVPETEDGGDPPEVVFGGVTVRHDEPTDGRRMVAQTVGDAYARVLGPVAPNQSVGLSDQGGSDYETNGAYLQAGGAHGVGIALEEIADAVVKLIKVRLGAGGTGGTVDVTLCDPDSGEESTYEMVGRKKAGS